MSEKARVALGEQIRQRRKALGVTQKDIFLHAGMPQPNLSALENGKLNVTIDTLSAIADLLGLEVRLVEKGAVE